MSEKEWEIQKYVTNNNICPFDEWFKNLSVKTQVRIDVRFDRLVLGNFGDYKSVGKGVYELRFFFDSGYRVYYGITGKRIVLLLTRGSKKSQNKDIKIAQKYWFDYKKEVGEN